MEEQKEFLNLMENQLSKLELEREHYSKEREQLASKLIQLEKIEDQRTKELEKLRQHIQVNCK